MAGDLFIGVDHGGSTTTALVLDPERGKLASRSVRMPKRAPAPGWVEHDPEDFVRTSIQAASEALETAGRSWRDVVAIGVANQGETSMAWSGATGQPLGPALSWEDRRTAGICAALATKGVDRLVRERTGLLLDPYFSASKFRWLLDNAPDAAAAAARGDLRLGGTDAYTIFRLTGGAHATDAATASRTALLNLRAGRWDADLLAAFGVSEAALPALKPTCGDFGEVRYPDVPASRIRVTADTVDSHAALFAQGCWDPTTAKVTYGTGAFIDVNTGRAPVEPDGLLLVLIAWEIDGVRDHVLEGGVFSVGSAIDWAVAMGLLPSAAASAELAKRSGEGADVLMVPCLTGLAAPHWDSEVRGCIAGLGLDTTPEHFARALLDGIAFQCVEVVRALDRRLGGGVAEVRADGGPTRNSYLMQRQADLLGMPVSVTLEPDMTALGAALLAAIGAGRLTRAEAAANRPDTVVYEPQMGQDERELQWERWRRTVAWARDERIR